MPTQTTYILPRLRSVCPLLVVRLVSLALYPLRVTWSSNSCLKFIPLPNFNRLTFCWIEVEGSILSEVDDCYKVTENPLCAPSLRWKVKMCPRPSQLVHKMLPANQETVFCTRKWVDRENFHLWEASRIGPFLPLSHPLSISIFQK